METLQLKIDGMSCGSCVASVTAALRKVPGVGTAEVDLARGLLLRWPVKSLLNLALWDPLALYQPRA